MNNDSGWALGILIVLSVAWYDYRHQGESVVYEAVCMNSVGSKADECQDVRPLFAINYRASFDNQTVVSWIGHGSPVAFSGCVVATAEDWQCHDKTEAYADTIAMSDGEFLRTGPFRSNTTFTVGKWMYRWLTVTAWLKPYLTRGGLGKTQLGSVPPKEAVNTLKMNPALSADFDAKYGAGASSKILGK